MIDDELTRGFSEEVVTEIVRTKYHIVFSEFVSVDELIDWLSKIPKRTRLDVIEVEDKPGHSGLHNLHLEFVNEKV